MPTLTFEVTDNVSSNRIEAAAYLLGCKFEKHVDENTRFFSHSLDILEVLGCRHPVRPVRDIERWPQVLVEMDILRSRIRELEERGATVAAAVDVMDLVERAAHKMRVGPGDVRWWSWPETFSTTGGPGGCGGMTPTGFQVFAFESYVDDARIKYCNGAWKKWDGYTQTW